MEALNPEANSLTRKNYVIQRASRQLETYIGEADVSVLKARQLPVMEDLYAFISTHPNDLHGYISLPTGVGKTVLFTEFVKATGLRTLVLTPTKLLLNQTSEAFNKFGDEDVAVGHVFGETKDADQDITITTYASFVRQTKHPRGIIKPENYDLLILDEAHKALGDATRDTLKQYRGLMQIGFTATDEYSENKKLSEILPNLIHKMSIKEAVDGELISPFMNIVIETGVDASSVKVTTANEYDASDLEKVINNQSRNSLAVDLYKTYFDGKKVVIFCNGVEHSKIVAQLFRDAGINAAAIHGGMSLDQQKAVKNELHRNSSKGLKVVTNDRILTEGFDEQSLAAIFNLAPTLSPVRAKQRGGRGLRLDPHSPDKVAYILDFIDRNLIKQPVLFADPKVAETAQAGVIKNPLFSEDTVNGIELVHSVRVILDTDKITEMASTFANERQKQYLEPPEGWLTALQISTLYEIPMPNLKAAIKELTKYSFQETGDGPVRMAHQNEGEFGVFHTNYGPSRFKTDHYSPKLVKLIAESQDLKFLNLSQGLPRSWKSYEDFKKVYSGKVLESLYFYLNRFHASVFFNNVIVTNGTEYFGPKIKDVFDKYKSPPANWKPLEPLAKWQGVSEDELERIYQRISKNFKWTAYEPPTWHRTKSGEKAFISERGYEQLVKEFEKKSVIAKLAKTTIKRVQPSVEGLDLNQLFDLPASKPDMSKLAIRKAYDPQTAPEIYEQDFGVA